jgi:DNA-binding transcriptional ArsR family regulator
MIDYMADVAAVAAALASPTRVAMVNLLLDGKAHAAGDLARVAGVTPSTASSHLAVLVDAGLVTMTLEGRQRRFRLHGPQAAEVIEVLAAVAPRRHRDPPRAVGASLRAGRTCYDHLAGRLGIAIADALVAVSALRIEGNAFVLTAAGAELLASLGVDVEGARTRRRRFAVACLDWTEHRHHLGGSLGAAMCDRLFDAGWVRHVGPGRAAALTQHGSQSLSNALGSTFRR